MLRYLAYLNLRSPGLCRSRRMRTQATKWSEIAERSGKLVQGFRRARVRMMKLSDGHSLASQRLRPGNSLPGHARWSKWRVRSDAQAEDAPDGDACTAGCEHVFRCATVRREKVHRYIRDSNKLLRYARLEHFFTLERNWVRWERTLHGSWSS